MIVGEPHVRLFFLLPATLLILACASTRSDFSDPEAIAFISSWILTYSHAYTEPEAPLSPWNRPDDTSVAQGPRTDLRLEDDIYNRIVAKSPVPITRDSPQTDGRIHLHALLFASGGCRAIIVTFTDHTGRMLAYRRIASRGDRSNFGYDDSFAHDAAQSILDLLTNKTANH